MNLLLDTHAFIWWCAASLGASAHRTIAEAERVVVSAASAWEAAIKVSNGKLRLPEPFTDGIAKSGFVALPVAFHHAEHVAHLPWHHRDPFDRILIAQAQLEGLTVMTADRVFQAYGVPVIEAR